MRGQSRRLINDDFFRIIDEENIQTTDFIPSNSATKSIVKCEEEKCLHMSINQFEKESSFVIDKNQILREEIRILKLDSLPNIIKEGSVISDTSISDDEVFPPSKIFIEKKIITLSEKKTAVMKIKRYSIDISEFNIGFNPIELIHFNQQKIAKDEPKEITMKSYLSFENSREFFWGPIKFYSLEEKTSQHFFSLKPKKLSSQKFELSELPCREKFQINQILCSKSSMMNTLKLIYPIPNHSIKDIEKEFPLIKHHIIIEINQNLQNELESVLELEQILHGLKERIDLFENFLYNDIPELPLFFSKLLEVKNMLTPFSVKRNIGRPFRDRSGSEKSSSLKPKLDKVFDFEDDKYQFINPFDPIRSKENLIWSFPEY